MQVSLPEVFSGLFKPYRYKAFHGGRGSAKSHSFATALVIMAAQRPMRVLCAREIQKSIKDSVKQLIDDKIAECGLGHLYDSIETEIRGKNGSLFLFAGLKSNPDSIKSMEGLDVAWVEEAARISQRSLDLLKPTLRADGSEIWFSWNPESEFDPVDQLFRSGELPPRALVKEVSWRDNPWFPNVLREEMEFDYRVNPEKASHIWDGAYLTFVEGSYYGKWLADLKAKPVPQITDVPAVDGEPVETWWDLGHSDATAIWFVQPHGQQFRILDYYENNGVGLEHYANEILTKPYKYSRHVLPHDAEAHELGTNLTRVETLRRLMPKHMMAIAPRQSVDDGINASRELLPRCWFDKIKCNAGLKALAAYHEKIDDVRRVGLGPLHDWASHGADAFRYGALMWRTAKPTPKTQEKADPWRLAAERQRNAAGGGSLAVL
jgi:phage terminase large subunit